VHSGPTLMHHNNIPTKGINYATNFFEIARSESVSR